MDNSIDISPRASALIESMRSIGYSLDTAVADLVDNSIAANATEIRIEIKWWRGEPVFTLVDNGHGMSKMQLINAMRAGSRSPIEIRSKEDLGRFGLGLKTASFSQCRHLTVATKQEGKMMVAIWDLDIISKSDRWELLLNDNLLGTGIGDIDGKNGTIVAWHKLDRLLPNESKQIRRNEINKAVNDLGKHLAIVFRRYLSGEKDLQRISIMVNGVSLNPFNPFNTKNPASAIEAEELIEYDGKKVRIQAFTLPHHSKTTPDEWQNFGGRDGYFDSQGFYVYRHKRLITYGTWFGLIRKTEATKLTRVKIDIENDGDNDWNLDIKKSRCIPPPIVKQRLKKITERLVQCSRRIQSGKGRQLLQDEVYPIWVRSKAEGFLTYSLNLEHPSIKNLIQSCPHNLLPLLQSLLTAIPASLPIDQIYSDYSQNPEEYRRQELEKGDLEAILKSMVAQHVSTGGISHEVVIAMISKSPLFANDTDLVNKSVRDIMGEPTT